MSVKTKEKIGLTWDAVEAEQSIHAMKLRAYRRALFNQHREACHRDAYWYEDFWSGYRVRLTRIVTRNTSTHRACMALEKTAKRWPSEVREVLGLNAS